MSRTDSDDSDDSYAEFAGNVIWPRSAAELTDTTRCPACRALLRSPLCSTCGLDLRHPASALLLNASTDAAASLDRRRELIGRIRFDVAEAQMAARRVTPPVAAPAAPPAVTAPAAPAPTAVAAPAPAPTVIPALAHQPPVAAPQSTAPPRSTAAWPPAAPAATPATVPAPSRAGFPPPLPPAAAASVPGAPKRSSVQVLLLLVGVTLVSVAAIFFLTVTWIFAGLEVRSAIIAATTIAALITAGVLRRKRLVATAEGIGVLAVVLVLLDAWALRQNDLFGLGSADWPTYWGATLVACTALFLLWHTLSGLRVASVAGFAAAAPGLGLLAAGLASGQDEPLRLFVGFLGAAVGALVHPLTLPRPGSGPTASISSDPAPDATSENSATPRIPGPWMPRVAKISAVTDAADPLPTAANAARHFWPSADRVPERVTVLSLGGLALVLATLTSAFVSPDSTVAPFLTLGTVTVTAVLHLLLVLRRADTGTAYAGFAYFSAGLAALTVTAIVPLVAYRAGDLTLMITVPLLVATLVPLGAEFLARHRSAGPARTALIVGGGTAAFSAALLALVVVSVAALPLLVSLARGIAGEAALPPVQATSAWAIGTLATVGLLLGLAWQIGGILPARRRVLAWLFLAIAVLAVPFSGAVLPVTLIYVLLGLLSLGALLLERRGRVSLGRFRVVVRAFLVVTIGLGYVISWQSSTTWWIGSVAAITVLLGSRLLLARSATSPAPPAATTITGTPAAPAATTRGLLLAGAIVLTLIAAVALPDMLTRGEERSISGVLVDGARALTLATAALHLLNALPMRLFTRPDRHWAFFTLLAPTVVAFALPIAAIAEDLSAAELAPLLQAGPAAGIVHAAVLLAALLLWLLLRGNRETGAAATTGRREILAVPRMIAAFGVAPVLLQLLWSTTRALTTTTTTTDAPFLLVPAAALFGCGLALTLGVLSGRNRDRIGLESGALLILVPGTVLALGVAHPLGWLMLLLAGVAALLTAIAPDGLFGSLSPRRHLGWVALALGIAGLWLGLARAGTQAPEPFVLPVAGMLLLLAVLIRRFGRAPRATAASPVAALLTLAGLLVAIAPLALAATTGSPLRAVLVASVSAVLLLGAGVLSWAPPRSAYLAAAAAAGATGLVLSSIVQGTTVLGDPGVPDARLEAWLLPLATVVAGSFLLARQTDAATRRSRRLAAIALLVLALTLLTIAEISTFAGAGNAVDVVTGVRASVLVLALSLTHVLALWRPRAPLTAGVGWAAAGLAAVAALSAVATGATEPFELVTVPLALAVVVGQVLAGRPVADAPELPRARLAASRRITAGLALALLPSALVGGSDESLLRPVLALALGGAMGLGGAFLLSRPRWTGLAWPALGVGTLTVVLAAGGRIRALLGTDLLGTDRFGPDTRLEAWLLPAVLLLIGIGAGAIAAAGKETATAANGTETTTPTPPAAATTAARGRRFGYGVLVFALVAGLLTELLALDYAPLAEPRVILLAWIFAAVHLTVVRFDRSGEGRVLGWVALGAAGVAVLAALTVVLPEPLELVTVPVGVALALGRLLAVRGRAAGASVAGVQPDSWWIALGLALGLLPSAFSVGTGTAAGDLLRPILVIGLGGVLAVSGAFLVRHPRWSPVVWPTVLVGLAAVATAAATRILSLLGQMPAGPNLLLEAWLLPAALLVAATGTTLTVVQRRADDRARHQPTDAATNRLGYGLLVVAIGGVLLTEVLSLGYDPLAAIRVTVLAWVFAALHLVVLRYDLSTWGRMLGWVSIGAAGLVVLAGWTRSVPDPFELATVPVGVALVLGRLLPARTKPGARASRPAGAASVRAGRAVSLWVTLGLAMALLPSAIVGAGGTSSELFRPLLVLVLGGTLAVAGAALVRQPRWSAAARPAAVVGLAAVGITAGARILPLLQETPLGPDARLEAWLLPALLIVVAAAACLVTAARRAGHAGTAPSTDAALRSGYGLIALAIVGTLAAEVLALGYAPLATIRVILLVFTFSALHIAAFWFDESRLGRMIAWVAIGAGGGAVVAGYANSAPATVEIVSVPLAIALLASGWLHLDAVPRARSWPWLAPGLLVLLAPPLLQDVTESALWRIVLLGLVATVVIVVGLVRKLQAPFVIGAIVLLVHGVAQLWPWISLAYGAVPWWLWLGAGGILLIVLAARYEQRIANFKAIALNISALR